MIGVFFLAHAVFLCAPQRTILLANNMSALGNISFLPTSFNVSHALNILRVEDVIVGIRKFRVSITINVTVSTIILPFTKSLAHIWNSYILNLILIR